MIIDERAIITPVQCQKFFSLIFRAYIYTYAEILTIHFKDVYKYKISVFTLYTNTLFSGPNANKLKSHFI